jgi:Na+/H+ antiporter NhaA
MFFPNALFLYWLFFEFESLAALLGNHLGVALFVDAILATSLLAYLFAVRPAGRLKWPWIYALTLLGGMGFGLGLFLWINYRRSPGGHASFASWWRAS